MFQLTQKEIHQKRKPKINSVVESEHRIKATCSEAPEEHKDQLGIAFAANQILVFCFASSLIEISIRC